MSDERSTRSSRRIATRRKVIPDDEDDSDTTALSTSQENEEVEEYTPAAAKVRASPAKRTTQPEAIPRRRAGPGRKAKVDESVVSSEEASQVVSPPPESVADEPPSPTRKSPPKRRSVKDARAARKSRMSNVSMASAMTDPEPSLLTPRTTASPEPSSRQSTALSDITESAINDSGFGATPRASRSPLDVSESNKTPTTPKPEPQTPLESVMDTNDEAQTPRPTSRALEVKKIDPSVTKLERPMDIVVRKRAVGIPLSQEPAEAKPRMTITYLILTNFKSYAGKQVVGPFHASFSSVVGPNGSGKSNVIDSLLFVFGFRASKMRQGKISALIHNSAQYPDLDFCEVEVHFQEVLDQPNGGSNVVPDSQLVISRRVFKNNSSKYYINERPSDFTTVTTLLKDRGIDLDHKRFLILQGEVESIAQMKPKAANEHDDGLLEYLEDIIGTSKYKTPIEEAATETEALNEVCMEKSNRVQHVEKEKIGLEDKKDKALAYIRDENELVSKQSALYQVYIAECGDNVQVTEEAIGQIQAELDEELGRHHEAEAEINEGEQQYKTGLKDFQKMEKHAESIIKQVDNLDKAAVKVEEKKKHLTSKAKKLEKASDSSKFGISESSTLSRQAEHDIAQYAEEIETLETEKASEDKELDKIREALKGKTQGLSDQIAAKQKQLEPWNARISEKQSAMAVAQSELDIFHERENAGSTAITEIEAKISAMREEKASKATELEECQQQQRTVLKESKQSQARLDTISAEEPALKLKLSNARQRADEARSSLSATQSQGNVLAGLTRLRESGRVDGFHGRLGNLGAIDAKYDVAISTACPALENMVVDTVEAAQQCIEYLRKNNLGRANFICLDKLPRRDMSQIQTPENCPRLFDLVKCKNERFLPAFYSVLQNTLVADGSEQADRVAYGAKRWRVVSIEGKLIDKSGTMSGGGNRVAKGAMSSKVSGDTTKEQVAELEVSRETLEQQYAQLQQQQQDLESRLRELQNELPKLETQAQKLSLELASFDRNIEDAMKRVNELGAEQQNAKSDKSKISGLEKSIASMQKDVEKLQSESSGIESEISQLQEKIMEIGGVKLRGQKAKVDGLQEQIDSLNESLSAAEVSRSKADKQRVKHEKAHADAAVELQKIADDLEKVEEECRSQSQDNSGLRRAAEEAKQSLDDRKDELQSLRKQLDDQIAELNETRGAEVEMRNKLEENQKILADNQKRLKYWEEKIGKLVVQVVGDDGEEKEPEAPAQLSRDELEDLDKNELKAAIVTLEERTSQHVELSVLAEYKRRVNEYSSRLEDLNAALTARDTAKKRTDDLRRMRLEGFMEGFSTISLRLKEMYQMITMGGNAELELVDSLDPFSEGILFSVMPPKKSWKNIGNLSGGEKTLSSLALVFALHHFKPTPLYVMDEIDAALDFRNVSIVAAYIKERTKNAQFIVISLRNNMFELAARLVGVYKVNHMTKSVTVENKDYIVPRVAPETVTGTTAAAAG